jgi:hypothetical protein
MGDRQPRRKTHARPTRETNTVTDAVEMNVAFAFQYESTNGGKIQCGQG